MNSKRSYLDTLNAGRQRRPHATLEQLNRSLEILERRLGDREAREPSPRPATRPGPDAAPAPRAYDRPSREASLAPSRPAEPARPRQPDDEAALGRVTGEIRTLREDLRQLMSTGMRREFETLRKDLEASHAAGEGKTAGHLGAEFDRLAGAIQALAERHDDRALEALREEIGQMRALADSRAETPPAWFGHRIDDLEERVAIGLSQLPSSAPEVAMLGRHLDVIAGVLAALPDSRAVRAIEDNMRELAGAVDRLAGQQSGRSEATFAQIDERLNEISRAIVAATVAAQSPHIDPEPFRRIEARVADLAGQIDELSAHRNDDDLARRLDHISDRMEHVAESAALPGLALDRLAGRIADIAEAVERAPAALDADRMMAGLEEHLHRVSDMLAGERGEAERQNGAMMREIEARIDSIVARIDGHRTEMLAGTDSRMGSIEAHMADLAGRLETLRADPAVGLEALRGIEMRMQHVAERFDLFSERYSGFDPDTIAGLERQVAELADRLSTPNAAMRDVEDMGLRLDEIEQAIAAGRAALLDAARDAAEAATRSLAAAVPAVPTDSAAIAALVQDLKSIEALTRRSDERNGKTFEAIHDTLLKIVDRLAAAERAPAPQPREAAEGKLRIEKTPAFDVEPVSLAETAPVHDAVDREMERATRSPSQAAADAALAALGEAEADTGSEARPRSLFGGLARALGRKPQAKAQPAPPVPPAENAVDMSAAEPEEERVDPSLANRPLEPGSGAPDLNAIMKRVREERGQAGAAPVTDTAKSDFIAAARRAAQAAAADSPAQRRKAEVGGPVRALRIGDMLKARRKPLLMATAAVTLGLAGMQLGKAFLNDPVVAADMDTPAVAEPAPAASLVAAAQPQADDAVDLDAPDEALAEEIVETDGDMAAASDEDPGITGATQPAAPQMPAEAAPSSPGIAVAAFSPVQPAAAATAPAGQFAPTSPAAIDAIPAEAGPAALRDAAAGGDARAMFEIGSRYAEGVGMKADMGKAAEWYRKAAGLGLPLAQYRIGSFYEKGLGVERSTEKARSWYGMAAEKGNANAMHNLAVLYAMDAKSEADNQAAARWFLAAAELGVKDSQFNLGILSAKGVGMKQNLEEGYKWFALVAKAGDKDAAAKREEIAKSLRPEQLARARAAAELWRAKPLDAAANAVDIPQAWQGEAPVAEVDMKKAVQNIQLILGKNGYDAGKPDGVMGARTKNAIKAFQKDNGIAPSGEIDETLVQALLARK